MYTVYLDYSDGDLQSVETTVTFEHADNALAYRDVVHEQAVAEGWEGLRSVFVIVGGRKWVD